MNIEQEIFNDFKSLSESGVKKRLDWCESVSIGLNKKLEWDEDFYINKFLRSVKEGDNIDWSKLEKLYPAWEPIKIPLKNIYPPPKYRTKKEREDIDLILLKNWNEKKRKLYDKIPNEEEAKEYLINIRWGRNINCPFCGSDKIYNLCNTNQYFKCANNMCYKKFNVRILTIFENTKLPLLKWYEAMYLFTSINTRKISTPQLSKALSVTQKTAWFMANKIQSKVEDDFIRNIKLNLFAA